MKQPPASHGGLALFVLLAALACAGPSDRLELWIEAATGMEFVRIRPGSFTMGSAADEPMREEQELAHRVIIGRSFWIGRTEVTQRQWQRLMGSNPSRFVDRPDLPVEQVNVIEIGEFLHRLNEAAPGQRFRLPTEAEWEYSCRAGTTSAFSTGALLSTDAANYDGRGPMPGQQAGEFRGRTTPVGSFPANSWGLHDLHGNVWEWTADEYCPYPAAEVTDPRAVCGADLLVIRGGSWLFGADSARCALRYTHRPQDDGPSLGFRVVREDPAALP